MPSKNTRSRPTIEQVRAGLKATLRSYADSGLVDNVRILAGCCPTCDEDDRVVLPLSDELSSQRLPHAGCERVDPGYPCACAYAPVVAGA
jgi:hypothetical protein